MSKNERLDSWKEISNYLNVSTRTCQCWEKKLKLPVYRIDNWLLRNIQTNKKKTIFELFYKIEKKRK